MDEAECIAQEKELKEAHERMAAEHVREVVSFIEPEIQPIQPSYTSTKKPHAKSGLEGIEVTMQDLLGSLT